MIITVINQKGGTGKTTTAVNLGRALAKSGARTMLVDFDPQGNLTYSLGIGEIEHGISDVLLKGIALDSVLFGCEGMDIAPTDQRLTAMELQSADNAIGLLKQALAGIQGYDYVIIDCPPSLSLLTINALNASDQVLIPIQLDVFSIKGLEQILGTIEEVHEAYNPSLKIMGVLPVLVDSRKKLTSEIKAHLIENFDVYVFNRGVRTNVKAAEAPSFGQSVIEYAPTSNSARDYLAVAKELKELVTN